MPDRIRRVDAGLTQDVRSTRVLVALPSSQDVKVHRARRVRVSLRAMRAFGDAVVLVLAFVAAYWLRYGLAFGRDIVAPESYLPISAFYPYIAAYTAITLVTFQLRGLYSLPRASTWLDHMRVAVGATLLSVAALTLGALLFNPVLPSRLVFLYLALSTVVFFGVERFLYRRARMWLWSRGINIRRAVVVGSSVAGQRIMKDIVERPELGYKLAGYLSDSADGPGSHAWTVPIKQRNGGIQRLGSVKDIARSLAQHNPQEVIVALPANQHAQILNILDNCRQYGVDFKLVPDLFEMRFNEVTIDALNGVPLIGVKDNALQGFNLFVKRVIDVVFGLIALLVAAIPMAIIALLIKATSPGPVLFKQVRVGKGGGKFVCYKFRSMYKDAEERKAALLHLNEVDGPIFKMKNDPRITPVGKVIRKLSLDELPQLFNILKGEMSWVGPRPPTPDEVKKYSAWHLKRLDVTPGLTGLWQVSGRSDLSFDEMVKLDLYYAENWTLTVDILIMLRTIPVILKHEGAY